MVITAFYITMVMNASVFGAHFGHRAVLIVDNHGVAKILMRQEVIAS
jgi:hypothetical protein